MATNFKYASQSDLQNYFNRFGDFDQKNQIFPTLTSGNLHLFRDCGFIDTLFLNGEELAAAQSTSGAVDSNGEWFYASATNQLEYYNSNYSATTVNEQVFEAGVDFSTFIAQQLVNASLELNNLLDARFPMPLEKAKQIDIDTATLSVAEEYDPVIIKATCYLAAANLIRSKMANDTDADYYHGLVTNAEGTGIVDLLNNGKMKLSFDVSNKSSKGSIKYRNVSGTMDIIELYGDYTGEKYDLLKVEVETTGVYGVGEFKVHYHSDDKIFGAVTSAEKITGGLQHIHNGLYGRFQGASATDGDIWEIEVYDDSVETTNTATNIIQLHR